MISNPELGIILEAVHPWNNRPLFVRKKKPELPPVIIRGNTVIMKLIPHFNSSFVLQAIFRCSISHDKTDYF